ncbi:MAG: PulJ/GspJ family protein [Planctomycetota bacterium]|jgi:hypothetical protein
MKKAYKEYRSPLGFTLAEVLASLVIGAMVLVAMLGIYNRAEKSAAAIESKLGDARLPCEVLQRIAEDLDGIIALGSNTRVTIENKIKEGYQSAKLTITKTIAGSRRTLPKTFEEIIWQANYDYDSDANGLVLYRKHSGMGLEDKLLDEQRADVEKYYSFVPVCSGVTFFKVQVPKGDGFVNRWPGDILPQSVVVTISFAEPYETLTGALGVLDEDKVTRTIAIDRTRKLGFIFVSAQEYEEGDLMDVNDFMDANDLIDANDVMDGSGVIDAKEEGGEPGEEKGNEPRGIKQR